MGKICKQLPPSDKIYRKPLPPVSTKYLPLRRRWSHPPPLPLSAPLHWTNRTIKKMGKVAGSTFGQICKQLKRWWKWLWYFNFHLDPTELVLQFPFVHCNFQFDWCSAEGQVKTELFRSSKKEGQSWSVPSKWNQSRPTDGGDGGGIPDFLLLLLFMQRSVIPHQFFLEPFFSDFHLHRRRWNCRWGLSPEMEVLKSGGIRERAWGEREIRWGYVCVLI